jgi:phosphoribosylglycinamide formyltransferase-1
VSEAQFISEPLTLASRASDTSAMSRGEPGLPSAFTWRDQQLSVARTLRTWKTSTADRGEMYLRRHWYELLLSDGRNAVVYFERQAKNRKRPTARWWLYTLTADVSSPSPR